MIKVSVIVLHVNNLAMTKECLASLEKLNKTGLEVSVIVVDNNSQDDFKDYEVIRNSQNLGYAGGNNVGIKKALASGADYIWVLNNDTVVDKNSLLELIKVAQKEKSGGVFGAKIYFFPGCEYHKERYLEKDRGKVIWWAGGKVDWDNVMTKHLGVDEVDKGQFDKLVKTESITGTAMLIRSAVFLKIGFFAEKYFLYFEESDFCLRVKRAGYSLWYVPKAVIWHKNAGSSGAGSLLHDYYITRNRLLFGFLYAPWKSKHSLLKQAVRLLMFGRLWQRRGVFDFLTNNFGKGSFPI